LERYVCIHGHFYQPPRENPWLEAIEIQDSAYPYHDWNERITAECYAPNTASHILDQDGRIIDIVNNYSKISFDFGPTLLSWMEKHKPEVYQAILEADKLSIERFSGHGSALAQAYNHMIMPLANRRDKYTQIVWGIKDFQKRFGRFPEGMWLPETAVDYETLEVVAELGIKFTILAPRQAKSVKKLHDTNVICDVTGEKVDPTFPYLCILPSGRTITIFFYDGPISKDIAFGDLLKSGVTFANRLISAFTDCRDCPQIVHIATDGETYGHHQRYGDMALAYCLYYIEKRNIARITNYGEYLEKHPPTHEVEIFENSSWSCVHGIERWKDNCGCNSGMSISGMNPEWTQAWRRPLREAMDFIRDTLIPIYEQELSQCLMDPWKARDDYIDVILDRSEENIELFFQRHAVKNLSRKEKGRALKLLETQRNAMLMYTSCGWFFDEISGIETTQVMQYASEAILYLEELKGISLESEYLKLLEKSSSNVFENGAHVYEMYVKPARIDLLRVGAHYAVSSLFEEYPEKTRIYCYTIESEKYHRLEAGKLKLAIGKTHISSVMTWDEALISFSVLHLGDHNVNGGVRNFISDEAFVTMHDEIKEVFDKTDVPEVIRLMDKHFGTNNYSLWHLFRDEQRKILDQILISTLHEVEVFFSQIYENTYPIKNFLQCLNIPVPKPLLVTAEYTVNYDLKRIFENNEVNVEKLENLINEVKKWPLGIDKTAIGFVASSWINSIMTKLNQQPEDIELINKIVDVIKLLRQLPLELDIWKAQNIYFTIGKNLFSIMKERSAKGDDFTRRWVEAFRKLGYYLQVKVS
jgi:alpha-amylase/alpha-mannosidase (GH57 family)